MLRWIRRLFQRRPSPTNDARRHRARLGVLALERRDVPDGTPIEVEPLPIPDPANKLLVTTNLDVVAQDGQISLREAIDFAQYLAGGGGHVITFAQNVQGTTITLDPARGDLIVGQSGADVTIDGSTNLVRVRRDPNAQQQHRLFTGLDNTTLNLLNLTLVGGSSANVGGAIFSAGDLLIQNCSISDAHAAVAGGGISFDGNVLRIMDSVIVGNSTTLLGGGIDISGRAAFISDTAIYLNSAERGGGIHIKSYDGNVGPSVLLDNVDVWYNTATLKGGGICVGDGSGAGTDLTLQGGTEIGENRCTDADPNLQKGGGIYLGTGTINLNGAWIGSNTAAQGDGLYWVTGTTVNIGNPGVTFYDDSQLEGPA